MTPPDPNKPILDWLTATVTAEGVDAKHRIDAAQIVLFHHSKYKTRPGADHPEVQGIKEHLRSLAMDEKAPIEDRIRAAMMVL